jgi:hypothetical protein
MRQSLIRRLLRWSGFMVLAGAGLASASGLAGAALPPLPTVTTVTVPALPPVLPTTPTVTVAPAPPLPLPPPPATPAPVPSLPAPPSVPASVPAPPSSATDESGSSPSEAGGAEGGSTAETGGGAGASDGRAETARSGGVRVRDGAKPGTVTIGFSLRRATTVVLTALGPLPSCAVAARLVVRGKRGGNAIPFSGRLGRERLDAGTYVLVLRDSTSQSATRAVVAVTMRGAEPVNAATRASAIATCFPAHEDRGLAARFDAVVPGERDSAATEPTRSVAPAPPPEVDEPFVDVRGIAGVEYLADSVSPTVVLVGALLFLVALAASIGGLVGFVRRHRQSA